MKTLLTFAALTVASLVFAAPPATPPQGEFDLTLDVTARNEQRGFNVGHVFRLERGTNGHANGNYQAWGDTPKVNLRLYSPAAGGKYDNVEFTVLLTPYKGIGTYPINTVNQTNNPGTVTNCRLMITTREGSYFDAKATGIGVAQYSTGMYWSDRRQPGKTAYTAPQDIGGWIKITGIDGTMIRGELLITLYGSGATTAMQAPWTPGRRDNFHRATLKGKFSAHIHGLDQR